MSETTAGIADFFDTGAAVIDPTGTYRYRLERRWASSARSILFVMLNPSTADAAKPDPTLTRCLSFARAAGGGRLVVVNLFAYRTPSPKAMWKASRAGVDIIGPENDRHIRKAAEDCDLAIAAWGAARPALARAAIVARIVEQVRPLHILRLTEKTCAPEHPLYLPGELRPVPWARSA